MNKKSGLTISAISLLLFTQCMTVMAVDHVDVNESAPPTVANTSTPPADFGTFISLTLPIISSGGGYFTHSKISEILGVDFSTHEVDDGLSSSYESARVGELSFRLLELKQESKKPFWMQAEVDMNGTYSVLDISMGGHCYSIEEAKSQLLSAGLVYKGEMPYLGEELHLFADKHDAERIFIYTNMQLDRIPSCTQAMRIVGYHKGG